MRWIFAILGTIFFLSPLAYTFLRLASMVGPADPDTAAIIGIVLWIFCIYVGAVLLSDAQKMSLKNSK